MSHVRRRVAASAALVVCCSLLMISPAMADPCGMVPPVSVDQFASLPIKRVGPQQTYVFYKNGLETFIIRPGYEGSIDEFGMLIPFPVPPAMRKAPDSFFEQLAGAIDPPEVVVDLTPRPTGGFFGGFGGGGGGVGGGGGLGFAPPAKDEVKVVRQEAVGMYEVAVLAAGSAKALKTWLEEHKYQYPTGMDIPCDEYVKQNWCFVAVKTRVAAKAKVDPQPAQREVDGKLPEGSIFDGHVQAMEFRFASRELLVPMRLSAYNAGKTRNVVYLLADKPAKIRNIPEEYVMRQMSGDELYDNLTKPLPVRIIGGDFRNIPADRRRTLAAERDPRPHNAVAADIFAGDLLAVKSGALLSEHEVQEKELLAIGEELELRGEQFDAAIARTLSQQRAATKKAVLHHVKDMVLTVVDGEFPREVLAKDNLRFASYEMPRRRSDPEFYDAKIMGPGGKKPGVLHTGAIDWERIDAASRVAAADDRAEATGQDAQSDVTSLFSRRASVFVLLVGGIGLLLAAGPRGRAGRRMLVIVVTVALASLLLQSAIAHADDAKEKKTDDSKAEAHAKAIATDDATISSLVRVLEDADKARAAVRQLVAIGEPAAPRLITIARRDDSLARRGWAIAALGRIGGKDAQKCLVQLSGQKKQPELIRLWASAARVHLAKTPEELDQVSSLLVEYPALERPLAKNIERQLKEGDADLSVGGLLSLCVRSPRYERFLAGPIVAQGGAALVKQMLSHDDQKVRRKAAGFVGAAAQAGEKTVAADVAQALAFQPDATAVPWDGGPLFLPGINWSAHKEEAKRLAGNLIAWRVWCDSHEAKAEQTKIDVNLGSFGLSSAAGYENLGQRGVDSARWVAAWQKAAGAEAVDTMLAQQGLAFRDGQLVAM